MASVWTELKRRNVVRVAIAYAVVSWLTLQFADVLVPLLGLPEWVGKFVFLLLAIGFPLALIFAWAYELTPEGLKLEKDVDRSQSVTRKTGRRIDSLIIGVLVIAVGMLLVDKFMLSESPESPEATEVVADNVPAPMAEPDAAPSVAVLPFTNMSSDEDSGYFSDGLADTVLHMLAQVRELRVAARTSSFKFRGETHDIAEIGEQLNVGAILEGSVQRSGDKIRVTAQLIDVSNGYHLWSANFDREMNDVFAIQDEIANEVVTALKVSLLGETVEQLNSDQTDNVEAYTEYLLGINALASENSESLPRAVNHLQNAIRLDPDYARAYSTLGRAYHALGNYGVMRTTQAAAAARNVASRALDISPDSTEALAVLGLAELRDGNKETAGQLLTRAIENGPDDAIALNYYAQYLASVARPAEALEIRRRLVRLDPLSEQAHTSLGYSLLSMNQYSEASESVARLKSINPNSTNRASLEAEIELAQGHWAAAVAPSMDLYTLDPNDPENPASLGQLYLVLDMPAEASHWFNRAVEVDAKHAMSRSAPLWLNYYLQQNEDENFRLARELLDDRIDDRFGSRFIALIVLTEHAAKTGRHDVALEALDNLYPHLFDDPPYDLAKSRMATYYVGRALIQSGDVDRGSYLMQSYLNLQEPYDEVYGVSAGSVAGRLILGDTDGALSKFAGVAQDPFAGMFRGFLLERSSVYDPIREELAFVELLELYRQNTEEQRKLLRAMNEDAS
jgi:TolB-like protein/Flp pilus assembly protein TadD